MEYISSDTNIWLDFDSISKTDLPFRLPLIYIMYREALKNEVISPQGLQDKLISFGLKEVELETAEFVLAGEYVVKYKKLSGYDAIALSIAKHRGITLVTGDNALRKAAFSENINVIGTIGLMDKLLEDKIIDCDEYLECLNQFLNHPERRLPADEIENRIKEVQNNNE